MKTYRAPALVAQGSVVAATQGIIRGDTDPNAVTLAMSIGSVGFCL